MASDIVRSNRANEWGKGAKLPYEADDTLGIGAVNRSNRIYGN